MIKVKVEKDSISIIGHANYSDFGKDIVCASVSSIVITSIEAIAKFNNKSVDIINSSDKIDIISNNHDDITDKLIDNMLTCLKEIEKQYPKNIKITNKEE